jgi:hypothetical protein
MTVSGEVSGCMVTQDVKIGGYHLPAQKVVAARELRGALGTQSFPLRYVSSLLLTFQKCELTSTAVLWAWGEEWVVEDKHKADKIVWGQVIWSSPHPEAERHKSDRLTDSWVLPQPRLAHWWK